MWCCLCRALVNESDNFSVLGGGHAVNHRSEIGESIGGLRGTR